MAEPVPYPFGRQPEDLSPATREVERKPFKGAKKLSVNIHNERGAGGDWSHRRKTFK